MRGTKLLRLARGAPIAIVAALIVSAPAYGAYGDVYVADPDAQAGATGAVIEVDDATGTRALLSANQPGGRGSGPNFTDPTGIAISTCEYRDQEAGSSVWSFVVADPNAGAGGSGAIFAVDPVTGDRTLISRNGSPGGAPNFVDPVGVAVTSDCRILVTDRSAFAGFTGGVISVDPVTGVRTTLSENAAPAGGPNFAEPFAISLNSSGDVVVGDLGGPASSDGSIINVDEATGVRTLISDNAAPAGAPALGDPMGLPPKAGAGVVNTANSGAFGGTGGIIGVNQAGGARTTVSENTNPAGAAALDFADPADIHPGVGVNLTGKQVVTDLTAPSAGGIPGGVFTVDAAGVRVSLSNNVAPAGAPQFSNPTGNVVRGLIAILVPINPGTFTINPGPRPGLGKAGSRRRGTTIRYTLDDRAARVRFRIERKRPGRIVDGKCVRQTKGNRSGNRRCVVYSRVGSFTQRGRKGNNRKRWNGRIRGRGLRPGAYRLTLNATAGRDNTAPPQSVDFRVRRR